MACTAWASAVVNALSEWLEVEISRDGKVYHQRYVGGEPVSELEVIGKTKRRGTIVTFKADPNIFDTTDYNNEVLSSRMRELAFLTRGLNISLLDERDDKEKTFYYKGGINEFVEYLSRRFPLPCTPSPFISPEKRARSRWRYRSSTPTLTRSACSASPTTSTPVKAAPTSRASRRP